MARGSTDRLLPMWRPLFKQGIWGAYSVEMPTHLLRALYVRDRWGIPVPDPPPALGVARLESRPELADDWNSWWNWLKGLDVLDTSLYDEPGTPSTGSLCPPRIYRLLDENGSEIGEWTNSWRRSFRDANARRDPAASERRIAMETDRQVRGTLVFRVLPLRDEWLQWVEPRYLLVSQRLRDNPSTYERLARDAIGRSGPE